MNVKSAPQSEEELIRKLTEEEALLLEKGRLSKEKICIDMENKQFTAEMGILEF